MTAHRFSQSAQEKIEQAGGTITILGGKKPVVKNKQASAKPAEAASPPPAAEPAVSEVVEEDRQRVRVGIPEPESAAVGGITGDDGAQSFRLFYGVLQR